MRFTLFAAAAGLFMLSLPAHADLTGDTIHVQFLFPDQNTVFSDLGDIMAPGTAELPGGSLHYGVSGSQISVISNLTQILSPADFNGFEFTDLSRDPMLIGAALDANSTLFDAVVSFTSNSVAINLQGLGQISADDSVIVDLTFAPPSSVTPEPSSVALLGTGMLGVAGVVRRRLLNG